jgi:hypothetical protein
LWRQSPTVLFPLEEKKGKNPKLLLTGIYSPLFPLLITLLFLWVRLQNWLLLPHLPTLPSSPSTSASFSLSLSGTPPYCDIKGS